MHLGLQPVSATNEIPLLDIRLENDVLIFRGREEESADAIVRGKVVLCISEPTSIKDITLVLQGIVRVAVPDESPTPSILHSELEKHEEIFYEKKWTFFDGGGRLYQTNASNFEYSFHERLCGTLPESVEGLNGTYVIYRLKAKVRRRAFHRDIVAKKHLRIVRTLPPGAVELTETHSSEGNWGEKLHYFISIPNTAVVFGTNIPFEMVLTPLVKGIKIERVTSELIQVHSFVKENVIQYSKTQPVFTQEYSADGFQGENLGDLGEWRSNGRVNLPKTLNVCLQDVDAKVSGVVIKVLHKVRFRITVSNSEGNRTKIPAEMYVKLFISPNYLMDHTNRIPDNAVSTETVGIVEAPPPYVLPDFYELYQGIPDYNTPHTSGSNTPANQSRNNSTDNLHLLQGAQIGAQSRRISQLQSALQDAGSSYWDITNQMSQVRLTPTPPPSGSRTRSPQVTNLGAENSPHLRSLTNSSGASGSTAQTPLAQFPAPDPASASSSALTLAQAPFLAQSTSDQSHDRVLDPFAPSPLSVQGPSSTRPSTPALAPPTPGPLRISVEELSRVPSYGTAMLNAKPTLSKLSITPQYTSPGTSSEPHSPTAPPPSPILSLRSRSTGRGLCGRLEALRGKHRSASRLRTTLGGPEFSDPQRSRRSMNLLLKK